MERLTRREFIKAVPFLVGASAAFVSVSCSRSPQPLPSVRPITSGPAKGAYALTEEAGGSLTDGSIAFSRHPFAEAVRFSFDPNRAGGSLVMETTLRQDSEFRLITEETDKRKPTNPGVIFCMSTREKAGTVRKYPVIRFANLEEYLISLGFKTAGEDCLKTYQEMLTYYIARDNSGKLQGRFEGLRTFDPNDPNLKPRDKEAVLYFDKGCLS